MNQTLSPTRILVAEDDLRTAQVLARLLRDDDYEVEIASDLDAAIDRLQRGPMPDLVVTDLRRPFGGDMAVARFARGMRPALPVVIISGDPDQARKTHAALVPPPTVLPKPLAYAQLCEEITVFERGARQALACAAR
jgi:two-component system response regulator MprA